MGAIEHAIFIWADSRRCSMRARLRAEIDEREIQLRTGCMLRAPFWPAKFAGCDAQIASFFERTCTLDFAGRWIFDETFRH